MRRIILTAVLLALTTSAFASNDINNLPALTQSQFHNVSADLGAILSFKQLQSAEPEGIAGFDVGIEASVTNLAHQTDWYAATSNSGTGSIPMAWLRASKGLPFGFDVGGFYSVAGNSNIKAYGGELRYAILDGDAFTPALGIRAAFSHLSGVSQLGFNTRSLDLTISTGSGPLTPYAGIGRVWINSNPDASTGLRNESFTADEGFVGLAVSLAVVNLVLEANRTAGNNTYSLKLGFGF